MSQRLFLSPELLAGWASAAGTSMHLM